MLLRLEKLKDSPVDFVIGTDWLENIMTALEDHKSSMCALSTRAHSSNLALLVSFKGTGARKKSLFSEKCSRWFRFFCRKRSYVGAWAGFIKIRSGLCEKGVLRRQNITATRKTTEFELDYIQILLCDLSKGRIAGSEDSTVDTKHSEKKTNETLSLNRSVSSPCQFWPKRILFCAAITNTLFVFGLSTDKNFLNLGVAPAKSS